jgi:hypothetical protein
MNRGVNATPIPIPMIPPAKSGIATFILTSLSELAAILLFGT